MILRISFFLAYLIHITGFAQHQYPSSFTVDSADVYWGTTIKDPYRWLENLKDSSVVDWCEKQTTYTNDWLDRLSGQQKVVAEISQLARAEAEARPMNHVDKAGGKYFYQKSLPGEPALKLFFREGEDGDEILLFDPLTFHPGQQVDYLPRVSHDGSRILMIITEAGKDIGDIHILDVATGKFFPDVIPHARGRFAGDSNTDILYLEYASSDAHFQGNLLNCPFKLHVMGTPVADDIILASRAKYPELEFTEVDRPWVSVFKHSPYIILETNSGGDIPLFYALRSELKKERINWKRLATADDEIKEYFVDGNDIYLFTSKGNPQFRIIKTSLSNPDLSKAEVIADGGGEWKISSVHKTKDYLLMNFSRNELATEPRIYHFASGKTEVVKTGLKGTSRLGVFSAEDNDVAIINTGWTVPGNIYRYKTEERGISECIYSRRNKTAFPEINDLVFEEIEVPSHDGALVPLVLMYNKYLMKKDGTNPCVMVGYGAYGATVLGDPEFDVQIMPLLNRGFVIGMTGVRGGGEKGNDWHLGGKKLTKPNTWKDFIACAEWVIASNYASREKMTGLAGSAGGILIGRAITERPDLFNAVICHVGMLNAVRTEFMPNGAPQIAEFGTVKDSAEFQCLLEMDAYHHIRKGVKYPAQLITASFKDFRVAAWVPAKFAARMQAANASSRPVFLYVDFEGGHFGSSDQNEAFARMARQWAFLLWQTGHPEFQVSKKHISAGDSRLGR